MMKREYIEVVGVDYIGKESLFSLVNRRIYKPIFQEDENDYHTLNSVAVTFYRDDGLNFTDELFRREFISSSAFKKYWVDMVERAVDKVKRSKVGSKSIIKVTSRFVRREDGKVSSLESSYLLERKDTTEYIKDGRSESKYFVDACSLDSVNFKKYFVHFKISHLVENIITNPYLFAIVENDVICNKRIEKLGEEVEVEVLEKVVDALQDSRLLLTYFKSFTENDFKVIRELPYIGRSNYEITEDDRVKIFLKVKGKEDHELSSIFFYLDSVDEGSSQEEELEEDE